MKYLKYFGSILLAVALLFIITSYVENSKLNLINQYPTEQNLVWLIVKALVYISILVVIIAMGFGFLGDAHVEKQS